MAVRHHGIPNGREGLQPVPPTLGAVAAIVRPWLIAMMPLHPPSIIVIIIVGVLALVGGIVVGGGTQGGRGAIPGSQKRSIDKRQKTRQGKIGGGGTNGSGGIE